MLKSALGLRLPKTKRSASHYVLFIILYFKGEQPRKAELYGVVPDFRICDNAT
jgi:hypothetical protein